MYVEEAHTPEVGLEQEKSILNARHSHEDVTNMLSGGHVTAGKTLNLNCAIPVPPEGHAGDGR